MGCLPTGGEVNVGTSQFFNARYTRRDLGGYGEVRSGFWDLRKVAIGKFARFACVLSQGSGMKWP